MPVYQYACTECGEQLEVRQSFTDATLTECPSCQGRLRKVLTAVGVVFKGSGFYRNDSRAAASGDDKVGAGVSSESSSGSEKSGESSAASKGAESTESSPGSSGAGTSGKGSSDKGSSGQGSSDKGSGNGSARNGKGSSDASSGGSKLTPASAR
ncbi:MAG: FmdB family zinc ribbon protein [Nocardioidaceae bacterium]